ncbi:MAG: response regulator transcription factor [Chloroflexi bacterium]|nr:response regulator transcription factor [Chloroflexota bacterium]
MATILVVDDEPNIVELARVYLDKEGFQVEAARNGEDALRALAARTPSLVVLDVMLPDIDGFEVCRRLRQRSDVPILMLTARGDEVDRIVGLELGADDYLAKPFNPRELTARIKAILRRAASGAREAKTIDAGRLHIDRERRVAECGGRPVDLRTKEFDLLVVLAQSPGLVFSRDRLLETVWGYDFLGESRTVDVHLSRLREKLRDSGVNIEAVRGVGYKLVAE